MMAGSITPLSKNMLTAKLPFCVLEPSITKKALNLVLEVQANNI